MPAPAIRMNVFFLSCRVPYLDDDVFFTELLKLDAQGAPQWESDGGLSAYRPLPNMDTPPPAVPLDLVSG